MYTIFIVLLIVHWACDFTHLSMPYMLKAKRIGKPLLPILHHAFMHAGFMLAAILCYIAYFKQPFIDMALICFFIQLVSHFIIDVTKGKANVWFPALSNPANPYHWYVFGLDQMLHMLVILWMCNIITTNTAL